MNYFKNTDVEIEMYPTLKYGDYRDWFIIDFNKPNIHKTEIQFFINDKFIYKDMMPINTKHIKFKFNSIVTFDIKVEKFKWIIPEMDIEKETVYDNPTQILQYEELTIDGNIDFFKGE